MKWERCVDERGPGFWLWSSPYGPRQSAAASALPSRGLKAWYFDGTCWSSLASQGLKLIKETYAVAFEDQGPAEPLPWPPSPPQSGPAFGDRPWALWAQAFASLPEVPAVFHPEDWVFFTDGRLLLWPEALRASRVGAWEALPAGLTGLDSLNQALVLGRLQAAGWAWPPQTDGPAEGARRARFPRLEGPLAPVSRWLGRPPSPPEAEALRAWLNSPLAAPSPGLARRLQAAGQGLARRRWWRLFGGVTAAVVLGLGLLIAFAGEWAVSAARPSPLAEAGPEEVVRAYYGGLQRLEDQPLRWAAPRPQSPSLSADIDLMTRLFVTRQVQLGSFGAYSTFSFEEWEQLGRPELESHQGLAGAGPLSFEAGGDKTWRVRYTWWWSVPDPQGGRTWSRTARTDTVTLEPDARGTWTITTLRRDSEELP